jgi:hypothetical protein
MRAFASEGADDSRASDRYFTAVSRSFMRLSVVLVAISVWHGSSAFAEPTPAPASDQPCVVTIVAAPDRVRAEIESWVAGERRCRHTLELRIEATETGLQVFARDERGHVRERVVPDDQSIGALVVSWIADDAPAEAAPEVVVRPAPEPVPSVEAPLPPPTPIPERALVRPVARLLAPDTARLAAVLSPPEPRQRWLTLVGALSVSEERKFGVRADMDVATGRRWTAGLFAAQFENSQASMGISITSAGGYVAAEAVRGDWQVRAHAGLGGTMFWVRNYCDCEQMGVAARTSRLTLRPISEVELLVGHALGTHWSFAGGALVTAALIDYGIEKQDRVSVMMFAGFRNKM